MARAKRPMTDKDRARLAKRAEENAAKMKDRTSFLAMPVGVFDLFLDTAAAEYETPGSSLLKVPEPYRHYLMTPFPKPEAVGGKGFRELPAGRVCSIRRVWSGATQCWVQCEGEYLCRTRWVREKVIPGKFMDPTRRYHFRWGMLRFMQQWQRDLIRQVSPESVDVLVQEYRHGARVTACVTLYPAQLLVYLLAAVWPEPDEFGTRLSRHLIGYTDSYIEVNRATAARDGNAVPADPAGSPITDFLNWDIGGESGDFGGDE